MTISAAAVWQVQSTANDQNGGGFVSGGGGTDRSQQDAAQVVIDNSAITTSITGTTVTFTAGYTPTAADVGNIVQFLSGTNVVIADSTHNGFYEIKSQTSSTWVLDRTPLSSGTTTNATAKMGGALASPGAAGNGALTAPAAGGGSTAGNTIYIKKATYDLSNSANVSGGYLNLTVNGSATVVTAIVGYNTTRTLWNADTGPTLRPTVNSQICIDNNNGSQFFVRNILFNANGFTGGNAWRNNNGTTSINDCQASGVFAVAFNDAFGESHIVNCYATGAGVGFDLYQNSSMAAFCVATACTTAGFRNVGTTGARHNYCISFANVGYGFYSGVVASEYTQCTSDGNTGVNGQGFSLNDQAVCINCASTNNANFGFTSNAAVIDWQTKLYGCAGLNNTSGNTDSAAFNTTNNFGFITLTANPYKNAAGGDFSLNAAAGGGAALNAAGYPLTYPGNATTGSFDIGASQHLTPSIPTGNLVFVQVGGS